MTAIAPERKVAIAFIRVFRKNLDETIKPSTLPDAFGDAQAEQAIRFLFGNLVQPPPALAERLKELFTEMNVEFLDFMNKSYDTLLPESIISAMSQMEDYLRENFTETELVELAALTENETILKLISGSEVFSILRKERYRLYEALDHNVAAYTTRPEVRERIQNAVQEFIQKPKLDDILPEDDDGSLDPRDIF